MTGRVICGLSADEIREFIAPAGFTLSHALHIATSIYKRRIDDFSGMAGIPKTLKEYLRNNAVT